MSHRKEIKSWPDKVRGFHIAWRLYERAGLFPACFQPVFILTLLCTFASKPGSQGGGMVSLSLGYQAQINTPLSCCLQCENCYAVWQMAAVYWIIILQQIKLKKNGFRRFLEYATGFKCASFLSNSIIWSWIVLIFVKLLIYQVFTSNQIRG